MGGASVSQYVRTAVDAWAVVAKAEAEDALCMETWLVNLKERWAGFTKLSGLTEQQQEQLMGEWCQRYFGPQDGEMGRYLLACYIIGSVGGMGGMMPKGA